MKITLNAIKEFWKLPEGQRFLTACFLMIGTLCSVITFQNTETIPQLNADKQILERKIGTVKEICGQEKLSMQRACDSEINDLKNGQLADFKEQLNEMKLKEKVMDEAIMNANQIIATQQRTQRTVRRTINEALNK